MRKLTIEESCLLDRIMFSVDEAMEVDNKEPEDSDIRYQDGGRFVLGLSEKEYKIFKQLLEKI